MYWGEAQRNLKICSEQIALPLRKQHSSLSVVDSPYLLYIRTWFCSILLEIKIFQIVSRGMPARVLALTVLEPTFARPVTFSL